MLVAALAAFIGCFAALVVLAELASIASKIVRYLAALILGLLLTYGLGLLASWVAHVFAKLS